MPGEDARFVFPNATRTNLVMTTNLRALIHMSGLRLCTMAQWEIRRLFQLIRHEVFGVSPFLGSFLAPKCVPLGYCDEFNNRDGHCPIRPHKDRVLEAWAEKSAAAQGGRPGAAGHVAAGRPGPPRTGGSPGPAAVPPRPRRQDLLVGQRLRRSSRRPALVTSETPQTSSPTHRAAMHSRTVDIPTACPPSAASIRTSAGVS